jgi:hypothetical protein
VEQSLHGALPCLAIPLDPAILTAHVHSPGVVTFNTPSTISRRIFSTASRGFFETAVFRERKDFLKRWFRVRVVVSNELEPSPQGATP